MVCGLPLVPNKITLHITSHATPLLSSLSLSHSPNKTLLQWYLNIHNNSTSTTTPLPSFFSIWVSLSYALFHVLPLLVTQHKLWHPTHRITRHEVAGFLHSKQGFPVLGFVACKSGFLFFVFFPMVVKVVEL
ncbi:hypothetical protein E2542_SST25236 [Spatholobus suberectus]|nr:hypothetical protein E2542_SST25236 [Spatholobus suberectus]